MHKLDRFLLKLARQSIINYFLDKNFESTLQELEKETFMEKEEKKKLEEKRGIFVTLKKKEELRGCIGFPYPIFPLAEGVFKAAREAAFNDPRFMPLSQDELKDIKIEITLLKVPRLIKKEEEEWREEDLKKIKIGKHGIIVKKGIYSALFLPQVATEWNFSQKEFVEQCCLKAGLPKDAWKEAEIYIFEARIIKENE